MTDPDPTRRQEARTGRLLLIFIAALAVLGVVYVIFLLFFAASEPERIANPADIGSSEVPSEGVAVPDGGNLTNEPTQAAPESPARTLDPTEETTRQGQ